MRLTAILAAALLMGSAAVSAHATTTYTWDAGQDTGTFTTGAMSPVDSGYFLLTDFLFVTADAGSAIYANEDVTSFLQQAAYDPSTQMFINHFTGRSFNDSGQLESDDGNIAVEPISSSGSAVIIFDRINGGEGFSTRGFNVTGSVTAPLPPVSAAPEPSSWLLMMASVAMIGGMLRLGRRRQTLLTV